jgi:putative FmdB family regulatory protein
MPTYEYACSKCGEHLEVVQSFRDKPLQRCPKCRGRLRKVFAPVGIVFKGSGFYKTDSRDSKKAKAGSTTSEKTSSDSESSSASSGASSEPAKTAAATDNKGGAKEKTGTARKQPAKSEAPAAAS